MKGGEERKGEKGRQEIKGKGGRENEGKEGREGENEGQEIMFQTKSI